MKIITGVQEIGLLLPEFLFYYAFSIENSDPDSQLTVCNPRELQAILSQRYLLHHSKIFPVNCKWEYKLSNKRI